MPKTYTPRYFWRRLAAYIIDVVSLIILLTAIVALIQPYVSTQLIAPTLVKSSLCKPVENLTQIGYAIAFLDPVPGDKAVFGICETSSPGSPTRRVLTIGLQRIEGNVVVSKLTNFYVDEQLRPLAHLDVGNALFLLMPLLFAIMLARTRTTFGKKLLGIRLENINGQPTNLVRYAKREYLRFLPGVLFSLGTITSGAAYFHPDNLERYISKIQNGSSIWIYPLVFGLVIFAIFITFLISFIRWRGGMVYDRFAGFEVRRSGEHHPRPERDLGET